MKKIGKRLLVSILSVLMIVSLTPALAFADGDTETPELVFADSDTGLYTSWYDASAESYELTTAQQLKGLAILVDEGNTFEGKTVKLGNDINLSGYGDWSAIGSSKETPFAGTFDGMNHTVRDLAVTDCTGGYEGLFGYNKGTIRNLAITGKIGSQDAFITSGSDNIGGLVGYNDGTVKGISGNVSVYINTNSIYAAGGIVGQNGDEGVVKECVNSADVTATKQSGGVVGRSYGEVTLCKNTGNITGNGGGKDGIGGIVGLAGDKNSTYPNSITYCYNTGTISNDNGRWHGGIAGMADSSASISNCYDIGQITPGYSWNWNPVIGHVDSAYETVKDNYSLEGLNAGDTNDSTKPLTIGTVKTAEEMYADEFVDLINGEGSGFQSSCGYPVLSWEEPAEHTYGEDGVCTVCGQTKPEEIISVIYGETTKDLTGSEIDALAGEESTKSFTGKNGTNEVTAAFIKLTDVLAAAGWTEEDFCSFKLEAGDGFSSNVTAEQLDEAFIYKQDDGSYRSAIDGSAGKMWVSGLTKITEIKEHSYGEDGACTICGKTEPGIAVIYGDTTKDLTGSEIDALAGEESTKSFTGHNGTTEITAAFIKLTDVLAAAGWTKEEFCCFRLEAGDGFTANIPAEQLDETYIYKEADGGYRSAIDGSAGKLWVSGLTKITEIKEHSYGEDGACTICGKTEVKASVDLVVDGESTTIEGSDIEALAGEETTKSYTGKGGEVSITAKFTKLTDLFENAGVNLEKVKYPVKVSAADGFTAEVDKDQLAEMYIFKQDDGTYRTAIDGSAGKMWVSGVAKIEIETDVNCPSEKFSDLDTSRWYHDAIDHVLNNHYFNGMSDTTFEPDSSMTRAMFVTVLSRMEGIDPSQYTGSSFSDVETGEWYSEAIQWASQNEIVKGVGNGKFDKNGNVTREQMAVILYNYAKFKGIDTSAADASKFDAFTDKDSVSGWAVDAMTWATSIGIINGMGDNTLAPKESSTRAQVAQIIKNYTDKVA